MKLQLLIYINMSIVYEDGWEAYLWTGYCVEIVFYFLTAFAVPITYKLLSSTPIFHPNTLMIFFTAIFSIYIFAASRLGLIYYEIQSDLPCEIYAETIDTCPKILIFFSILRAFDFALVPALLEFLLFERLIATIRVETYETIYHPKLLIFILFFIGLFSAFIAVLYTFGKTFADSNQIRFLAFISFVFAVIFALWISFSSALSTQLVIRINEKKEQRLHISDYSLSKRYQLSENIRSAQILSYLLWFVTVSNTLIGGAWMVHSTDISPSTRNIIGTFLTIFMAFYFCVTSVFGIFVNRRIYTLWKALARAKFRKFFPSFGGIADVSVAILDVKGKVLYTGANQADYFQQLQVQWASS